MPLVDRCTTPVERVSGKTPKNLRLHCWLALFCARLPPHSFMLLPNLRLPPDPFFPFTFPFARASARAFHFFSGVSAIALTGLPNQGSAWFLPSCGGSIPLQWSPDLEDPVRLDKLPLVLPFFRSTKGVSFPFKVGCSRNKH